MLEQMQQQVKQHMDGLSYSGEPQSLYDAMNYILGLGGKRLRPFLVSLGCQSVGGKHEDSFPAAEAVELFHNFTLIHDDIMDKANLRRGKKTVHVLYGENTAILAGDLMLVEAYDALTRSPHLKKVMPVFNRISKEVCEGQQMDLDLEKEDHVDLERYLHMISMKTSVLLGGALEMGAIIGNGTGEQAGALYEYGVSVGMAFQLQDDVLDVFGDEASFGKQVGGDILANKKTMLYIAALDLANSEQQAELRGWYRGTDHDAETKVVAVRSIFESLGVREVVEKKMAEYNSKAKAAISGLDIEEDPKTLLKAFSDQLLQRTT